MRRWIGPLSLALTMTGIASAQPAPPGEPAPPPMAPNPPPAPEPADATRPTELAFGIGFGYFLPTSLQTPNITSVRIRLPSGITIEPQLVFAFTSDKVDMGATVTNKQNELTLASLLH